MIFNKFVFSYYILIYSSFIGWLTVQGKFFMVNGANVSCACSRSPMGFSPHCHIGDGCVDVILVRHTSFINNIRMLLRLSSKQKTLVSLSFINLYFKGNVGIWMTEKENPKFVETRSCWPHVSFDSTTYPSSRCTEQENSHSVPCQRCICRLKTMSKGHRKLQALACGIAMAKWSKILMSK